MSKNDDDGIKKNLFKLHNGKGLGKDFPSPEALRSRLEHFGQCITAMLEYEALSAKITRGKYLSLLKEGFTKQEALYLCGKK